MNLGLGLTHVNLTKNLIGGNPYESGALFSYANNPAEINIRVGVSFVSVEQACANAETEIGNSTFEEIRQQSVDLWNEKLSKLEIDVGSTNPNVTEMLYSSMYRSFLTPNNATGEGQGLFANTTSPYFDSLYCSWDTVSSNFIDKLAYLKDDWLVPNILSVDVIAFASRFRRYSGELYRWLAQEWLASRGKRLISA